MSATFLVELASGSFILKSSEELQTDDKLVFDGPNAFADLNAAQDRLEEEILAAGGLEAWRAANNFG